MAWSDYFAAQEVGIVTHHIVHSVSSAEATAGSVVLNTGFVTAGQASGAGTPGVLGFVSAIWRAGANLQADATFTLSAAHDEIEVEDVAEGDYALTVGDRIVVIVFGRRA